MKTNKPTSPILRTSQVRRPSAQGLFDAWVNSHPQDLSEFTMSVYNHAWTGYVKYLSANGTDWQQANTQTVNDYLVAVAPMRKEVSAVSPVTQRRYWRILRDIYSYALIYEWVKENPVLRAKRPHSEVMPSLILPAWAVTALVEQLAQECRSAPATWQEQRDRAMLALMLSAAPKTGELIALKTSDVKAANAGEGFDLTLAGPRKVQQRTVALSTQACRELNLWLEARTVIEGMPETLFFSQKRITGTSQRCALTHKTIYIITMAFLNRVFPAGAFEYGLYHQGAELIRNAVIANWLEDPSSGGIENVMVRAGVKDRRTIERLDRNAA